MAESIFAAAPELPAPGLVPSIGSKRSPDFGRGAWFREAQFGLFVHWGLYSVLGRGEWALNRERIPWPQYRGLADSFLANAFDPASWARDAVAAGMKYAVLTAKHHEGFCLWNSRLCPFNSANSAAGRDIVAEFAAAMRSAGLKVGLYYSLGDWSMPDWYRGLEGDEAARARFMDYTHGLVRELMTGYGPIDILWYDLPQGYSAEEWRSLELNAMVRSLQPGILINNRSLTPQDFSTPEQHVKRAPAGRLWEACLTMNNSWGYRPADNAWKTQATVVKSLVQAVSRGGNLLLNVGPDGDGAFPPRAREILAAVAAWRNRCGRSLRQVEQHDLPWLLAGEVTLRGHRLWVFLDPYEGPHTTIGGLTNRVLQVTLLGQGAVGFEQRGPQLKVTGLPALAPDPVMTVVEIELDGVPDFDISRVIGGADCFPGFPE